MHTWSNYIFQNYVRRLGFEETPDYDFLRELFTKVLKNMNEPEDGIYDWMLLHGGKGWESTVSDVHACLVPDSDTVFFFSYQQITSSLPHPEERLSAGCPSSSLLHLFRRPPHLRELVPSRLGFCLGRRARKVLPRRRLAFPPLLRQGVLQRSTPRKTRTLARRTLCTPRQISKGAPTRL